MIFKRVKLKNWRNFRDAEVRLAPRTFIVGANASGKSNFLDAIRFLNDITPTGVGFEKAVLDKRGGIKKIRSLHAHGKPDVTIAVEICGPGEAGHIDVWEYSLSFNADTPSNRPIITEETIKGPGVDLRRPSEDDKNDNELLRQTWVQQAGMNKRFRPLVEFFGSIKYSHLVPQLIREPGRVIKQGNDPYGSDFLEIVAGTHKNTREARLRRIGDALKTAVPEFDSLKLVLDPKTKAWHLEIRFEHWRGFAAKQNEDQFSDGTLRLIGFLWAILDGDGPLLLEEPELSLHKGIVRRLAALIYKAQHLRNNGPRQVIVSTHSYDLLDENGIGGEEVIILQITPSGTRVMTGKDDRVIRALLEAGATAAAAVFPTTEPKNVRQLGFGWERH
jgi:predicted ATPase